jgi:hypothetical protein
MPFFATLLKDAIFGTNEHRHAMGHDVGTLTPIVVTPPKDAICAQVSLRMPLD